ncbi:SUKH-3 domain-containing protein [Streptomyces parvus]|uniref:SUKH-3 domain-containing protein n=1 Tax=Streptomyces parvus TaxID=66428 RepID=UPI002101BE1F|nr:SUKH-3 domain-containing protein [Streptomyces parvus]MCQ1579826.1 SUKH-3 domain-containing protein [Streptomyces parvus]
MVSVEEWIQARRGLRLGQRLSGTVTAIPRPGATGIFVDVGLPVGGFVDVLLLPFAAERWPEVGTVAEFEVWWADERPQVRLKPVDSQFLCEDFDEWLAQWRPGWPENIPVDQAWVEAAAAVRRDAGEVEETLRAAGWQLGRRVPIQQWREMLEATALGRMHEAAERFLTEFGGLDVQIVGPGITCARTPFNFDPELAVGEEDRFADWSSTVGRNIFPIGELDEGRFFLGIDETSEVYLIGTWVATFGPVREALEKLVLGIAPRRIG